MPAAHPVALRRRVVDAYLSGEGSYRAIGERFRVGEASVNRWVRQVRAGGSLDAKRRPKEGPRLIDARGEDFVVETLEAVPDSTAPELVAAYEEVFGVVVSDSTMKRALRRLGFTRKRGPSAPQTPSGGMSWTRESAS